MTEGLHNIILTVFNEKIAFATELAIRYGPYSNEHEQYKFIYDTYTCAAFTISSFDERVFQADQEYESYDCDEHKSQLKGSQISDPRYKPESKGAQYLSILKVILTGNDEQTSQEKVTQLTKSLNFTKENNQNSTENGQNSRRLVDFHTFKDVLERCMQGDESEDPKCGQFLGLNLDYFAVITLDAEAYSERATFPRMVSLAEQIVYAMKYFIYIFIGVCFMLSISGKIYAKKLGSDNVKPFGILFFSLYTWDFYSDVMFSVRLYDAKQWILFVVSMVFILVPWTMNMIQLFRAEKAWTADTSIKEGVTGWFIKYNSLLILAVGLSGNSCGAIELANSNLFAMNLFSMGLNPKNLKEFQSKRLYSSVLTENIPVEFIYIITMSMTGVCNYSN